MDLTRKNSFLAVVCYSVLLLCPLVHGGCQEDLIQDSGFKECVMGFGTFFTNLAGGGSDMSDPDAVFKMICSKEGQAAFGCILGYMDKCPELAGGSGGQGNPMDSLSQIPGFDMNMFMEEGALEGTCAMMTGPCSEVKNCYMMPQGGPSGGMVKRGAVTPMNHYLMFHSHAGMMCGPMKQQMECVLTALDKCPASVVSKVEMEFEKAVNMTMQGMHGITSFKDTKHFVQMECPKMPKDFAEDTCSQMVYASQNFTACNDNVTMTYDKERTCNVYFLSNQCVKENIEPKCGPETAMFLTRNTHLIFPGIPDNCDTISGSNVMSASFGTLLLFAILSLLFMF